MLCFSHGNATDCAKNLLSLMASYIMFGGVGCSSLCTTCLSSDRFEGGLWYGPLTMTGE